MEEQTLLYYSKVFSISLIVIFIFISSYIYLILNKNLVLKNNPINIKMHEKIDNIIDNNINNLSALDIEIIKIYLKINLILNQSFFHYGDFYFQNNSSFLDFINIITKPSNIINKITIIEGWTKKQLNSELTDHFKNFNSIDFKDIIADTYFINKNSDFNSFIKNLKNIKFNYFKKFENNYLFNDYTFDEIMIIGSILEKEGLDRIDKKMISSVIFNRLNRNMKLQIDATVLFAITNGEYNLDRKILLSDLKIDHPYNTYINKGLPPGPISYVGRQTLDIIFENYKTDFLFYFYNNSLNKHIFSKTYKEHKKKLNEYRNKK